MRSPIRDYLDAVIRDTSDVTSGKVSDDIPELARVDPDLAAVSLATVTGTVYSSGDHEHQFSIQSMSKPFAYAMAIEDHGIDEVLGHVGVEPSGDPFNEFSLDERTAKPRNPMINAGAIATHGLIKNHQAPASDRLMDLYSQLTQRDVEIDESVVASEMAAGDRNLGLAYLLSAAGALHLNPPAAVAGYVRQCAAMMTVDDLALMAATLANGGVQPNTGNRIFSRATTKQVLSVMASCGMYDAAGDWMTTVGIPAKSGVAGGIIGVLPGQIGVAVFSPRLDHHGNSTRGSEMMRLLSENLGLHLMTVGRPARSSLREVHTAQVDDKTATIYALQGDLSLSSIEALVHEITTNPPQDPLVVFDMTRIDEVLQVARETASSLATTLIDQGHRVIFVDPTQAFADFRDEDGRGVERWSPEELRENTSGS